jgi:hypothetical protein
LENNLNYSRRLPDPSTLPPDLVSLPRWIAWDLSTEGKKIPKQRVNDPRSWFTLTEALAAPGTGGIGFVFTLDDDIGGIDLDSCRDPETGNLDLWAQQLVSLFDSYTEISPSGTGVKIFAKGAPPKLASHIIDIKTADSTSRGGKKPQVEVYVTGRYFAVTGDALPGSVPGEPLNIRPHAWLKITEMLSALSVTASARSKRQEAVDAEVVNEGGGKEAREDNARLQEPFPDSHGRPDAPTGVWNRRDHRRLSRAQQAGV